jgi:predicted RNA polymerase sigma factor
LITAPPSLRAARGSRPDPAFFARAMVALLDALELDNFYLFHAVRADLLVRLDRKAEAAAAYESAIVLTTNAAERAFLERRRALASGYT